MAGRSGLVCAVSEHPRRLISVTDRPLDFEQAAIFSDRSATMGALWEASLWAAVRDIK